MRFSKPFSISFQPAPDEPFLAVELGIGEGWLSEAILERFPPARVLGLDGSPTMLRAAEERLRPYADRFEARQFRLEDRSWLERVGSEARCFVSSLVIHHLDAEGKQTLYHDLHARLSPGGAVLIADLVAPRSERERRYLARQWDAEVRRQSLAMSGSLQAYQQFTDDHWNWYDYHDPDGQTLISARPFGLADVGGLCRRQRLLGARRTCHLWRIY